MPKKDPTISTNKKSTDKDEKADVWVLGMHECIVDVFLKDASLASLRAPMAVVGPRSPGRGVSSEEWAAIGLYISVIWEKL